MVKSKEPVLAVPQVQCKIQELQEQWMNMNLASDKLQTHVYTNMRCGNHRFSELFNELFRPNGRLQKEIDYHRQYLGENYVSISFVFERSIMIFYQLECKELI